MNDLTLVIVNNGGGYDKRCAIGRQAVAGTCPSLRLVRWAGIVELEAHRQRKQHDATYTLEELVATVLELDVYYVEHAREDLTNA